MKLYSPAYYKDFKCVASACKNSCCVGWEIDVDEKTMGKYKLLNDEDILRNIEIEDGLPHLKLCPDGRCPFLDGEGLCRIISSLGEEYISEICREHPRFYHRIGDICEVGLGLVCEEAARIILTSDSYREFVLLGEREGDFPDETDYSVIPERDNIYKILSDRDKPLADRLREIREKYNIPEQIHTPSEWDEIFDELEYLDSENRLSVGKREQRENLHPYFERFFAYLVFRHGSVADGRENFRYRLAFCFLLLEVFEHTTAGMLEICQQDVIDIARRISAEIEYSVENTEALIFEFEALI